MSVSHPSNDRYKRRRQNLMRCIRRGLAVIPSAVEKNRSHDTFYPFRQDSLFYYLTGFDEPDSLLVLCAEEHKTYIFCRPKDLEQEIWDGDRIGVEQASEYLGVDEAVSTDDLDDWMSQHLGCYREIYFPFYRKNDWDHHFNRWIAMVAQQWRRGDETPSLFHDVCVLTDEMRVIKSPEEQDDMREVCQISALAHRFIMEHLHEWDHESQVMTQLHHRFAMHGAIHPAYGSIVAAGMNACTLHYVRNNAPLQVGDLLLIDAGAEHRHCYAGDVSRTLPIAGRYSGEQREIYNIVLAAQHAAMREVSVGKPWDAPNRAAIRVLTQGLIDLKLLQGSVDNLIEQEGYKRFYMHGIGHYLGMDVHDVGSRKIDGRWRPFQAGMCLTIEPGLYIRPADDIPECWHGMGIRIEDDVLIHEHGLEVLTDAAPTDPLAIEELMQQRR